MGHLRKKKAAQILYELLTSIWRTHALGAAPITPFSEFLGTAYIVLQFDGDYGVYHSMYGRLLMDE